MNGQDGIVYSFDIFDTVITRAVGKPGDVFLWMQEKLNEEKAPYFFDPSCVAFKKARHIAESAALWRLRKEDVTLHDIYRTLETIYHLPSGSSDRLLSLELETETLLIRPVEPVCERVRALIADGRKVIFITDMYLPRDFLKGLLASFNILVGSNDIFVSGELGMRKATGRLYRHVLLEFNILPGQLHHFGDNLWGDVIVPGVLGICVDQL